MAQNPPRVCQCFGLYAHADEHLVDRGFVTYNGRQDAERQIAVVFERLRDNSNHQLL
jgi:hypothetical protein